MSDRNLFQRINAVMADVSYIKKDKQVSGFGGGYSAVTHDHVTAALRPSMVKHGIVMTASVQQAETVQLKSDKGKTFHRTTGRVDVTLFNIDKPEDCMTVSAIGIGDDFGDKGPGKFLSYAVKTALLKLFMIETGESDESRIQSESEPPPTVSQDQAIMIGAIAEELDIEPAVIAQAYGVEMISKIPADKYDHAINRLEATKKAREAENGDS